MSAYEHVASPKVDRSLPASVVQTSASGSVVLARGSGRVRGDGSGTGGGVAENRVLVAPLSPEVLPGLSDPYRLVQ